MDVTTVDNTSLKLPTLKHIVKLTLGRNPMDVISVGNTSLKWAAFKSTGEFTLGRNPNSCDGCGTAFNS